MPIIQGVSISTSTDPVIVGSVAADKLIALIDTGADMCAIDTGLATSLAMVPLRKTQLRGSTGPKPDTDVYLMKIIINTDVPNVPFVYLGQFVSSPLKDQGYTTDLLIGEDVIQHFELSLNRSLNQWVLTRVR